MKKQKLQLAICYVIVVICMLLGAVLGMYIIGKENGHYNYNIIYATLTGLSISFLATLVTAKYYKKRNKNIPIVDERTLVIMKRYFMIVLYVVLFGSSAILLFLYSIGVHSIETGMLIVYMMCLFIIIGIGTLIAKKL